MTIEPFIERVVSVGLLVIGLSHLFRSRMWADLFEEWRGNRFLPLYPGWLYMQVGSVIAFGHNVWVWDLVVIITAMGWLWVVKGAVYLLWPSALTTMMSTAIAAGTNHARKFAMVGALMTAVGALLVWRVFFKS